MSKVKNNVLLILLLQYMIILKKHLMQLIQIQLKD